MCPLFSWLIACSCELLCVIALSSVWIHVNFPADYLAFFFLFCHSISSTFSLFYFHFKGLSGTDVVSNACLLPHCLKVRDDYFLMKPGVLAQKKWILPVSCEIDKQYFRITLNENIHSFPHTTKAILKFSLAAKCAPGPWILISLISCCVEYSVLFGCKCFAETMRFSKAVISRFPIDS